MSTEMEAALKTLVAGMGLQLVQSFTSRFDPDAMVQEASEKVGVELRNAFQAVLEDVDSDATQKLLDDLFQAIDLEQVISAIAQPLAQSMTEWFKENSEDLINAIIEYLDMEELASMVADKVAERIQLGS